MPRPSRTDQSLSDKYLHQLLENLEEEWESMKHNHSEEHSCTTVVGSFHLLDGSPRALMSSLQNASGSSSGEIWKVRNNSLAAEEIARERKAAMESCKLKGRRLFDDSDDESEARSVISYGDDGTKGDRGSCSRSSSTSVAPEVDAESLWRRWRGFVRLISVVVAVGIALGLGFEGLADEQVILVPT